MDAFLRALNAIHPLPPAARSAFVAAWQPADWPKGHYLVREGGVCHHIYYVAQGLVRIYYHKGDKEITEWLAFEQSFCFSITSFFRRQPSRLIMQLLEPGQVRAIHHDDLMRLCDEYPAIERMFRLMLTGSLLLSQERVDSLQFETARQRYQRLLATNPSVIQRVPLAYIASFLGITQETLSRIRCGKR